MGGGGQGSGIPPYRVFDTGVKKKSLGRLLLNHAKAGVNGGGSSRGVRGLIEVAEDCALRQRLLELVNLRLGDLVWPRSF